uniref:sigma-54 interaction domain-containing protein n=1 Tax=Desulfovibrio sp. TaxID=885 RepID=UPI0025C1E108
ITRLSGYEKSTMIGSNVFEGLQHGDYKNSCVAKVLQTKVPYVTINEYSQWGVKKGESKGNDCLVSGTPIFDRQKNLKYAVSIARDISELQQIQEELQKTKTLSMIYNRQIKSFQQQTRVEIAETRSKIIENLFELANQVADIDLPILLVGETGVGKDFFANYIHAIGAKSASPFLKINCSAIPDTLLESELFGYEAGAFTGASKEGKQGLFEISGDGSLFLDEVGDMPYLLQAKLLGVLQDKTIMPLGGNKEIKIKSRIIAATNANLEELIKQKKFRLDLFYRLNVIQFKIPPLRERKEDIIFFANKFLRDFNNKHNKNVYFSSDLYDKMLFYPWPGNIRELKNTVERIVVMSKNGSINKELLLSAGLGTGGAMPTGASASGDLSESPDLLGNMSLKEAVARYEADVIAAVMRQTDSVAEAAMRLGIDVSTLLRKRKKTKRLSASKKERHSSN